MITGICCQLPRALAAARAGYRYIEPSLCALSNMPQAEFAAARRELSESGLCVNSVNGFFDSSKHRLVGDGVDFAALRDHASYALERAALLGCKIAVLGSGACRRVADGFDFETARKQFAEVIAECAKIGAQFDITVAAEPLNANETNLCNTLAQTAQTLRDCDMPNVGLTADLFHMQGCGETAAQLPQYGEILRHVHVCNPVTRGRCAVGDGCDYSALREVLRETGYRGAVMMEWKTGESFEDDIAAAKPILDGFAAL